MVRTCRSRSARSGSGRGQVAAQALGARCAASRGLREGADPGRHEDVVSRVPLERPAQGAVASCCSFSPVCSSRPPTPIVVQPRRTFKSNATRRPEEQMNVHLNAVPNHEVKVSRSLDCTISGASRWVWTGRGAQGGRTPTPVGSARIATPDTPLLLRAAPDRCRRRPPRARVGSRRGPGNTPTSTPRAHPHRRR